VRVIRATVTGEASCNNSGKSRFQKASHDPVPEVTNSALATFAGQVTAHREQRKWSKAQLATRMGFDASYIAHVENMTKPPTLAFAGKCDEAFGLPGTFAALPNISVQIMPFRSTRHTGGDGPLSVIEYRGKPAVWFTEGRISGRMSEDRTEVLQAQYALSTSRAAALPVHESAAFIRSIREASYEQLMA
jgi:transcriptional regulator with XRE-family HTH domain